MSNFFDSEIVKEELEEIKDLQNEIYGKIMKLHMFDRDEKVEHIEKLETLLEKQRLMFTRLSLSDDSEAIKMKTHMQKTVGLMGLSVALCVFFGVIIGTLCSQSNRFLNFMSPILDTMQVMPAFVYLLPAIFFFGIGGAPAILATMIYSMPPIIRLTNTGIRQVSEQTIESATSFGSNRLQLLFKIKIPSSVSNEAMIKAVKLFIRPEGRGRFLVLSIKASLSFSIH